ncbi:5-methylcytosine rRNA methyltransferase NSUN4 [Paragonimus westermani]|uniref:NOL1/NOP2/Sun domain family member 4 n=1 Tax=Paragonimus westermani TaxID=34504 RepID=A0A5J4N918_9TREM|nr:5-methylcytosine rRNA methyltransferase NSUN4 [Paragonimus westermani]
MEFVPVTELISESELFSRQCDHDVTFTPTQLHSDLFDSVSDEWNWPQALRVKCTRRGWVGCYRAPTFSDGQFNFFPMDLGSVVPVLALNLQQGDSLLDLCAAPGGKSVVALQTLLLRRLVCVDNSAPRLIRLKHVLATHSLTVLSDDSDQPPGLDLNVLHETQLFDFIQQELTSEDRLFDKVLVDVPCSTDRHALTSDEGNLFSRGKSKARSSLPERQMALLQRAMRLCRPGGSVVYSTCTLSPAQNQAVIEACLAKSTGPDSSTHFALVDLSPLANAFSRCYNNLGLHILPVSSSHLPSLLVGLLVVPLLSANYGPTFVAKLRRIR